MTRIQFRALFLRADVSFVQIPVEIDKIARNMKNYTLKKIFVPSNSNMQENLQRPFKTKKIYKIRAF